MESWEGPIGCAWKQQSIKCIQMENIEHTSITRVVNLCRNIENRIESTGGNLISEGMDCQDKQCEFPSLGSMTD